MELRPGDARSPNRCQRLAAEGKPQRDSRSSAFEHRALDLVPPELSGPIDRSRYQERRRAKVCTDQARMDLINEIGVAVVERQDNASARDAAGIQSSTEVSGRQRRTGSQDVDMLVEVMSDGLRAAKGPFLGGRSGGREGPRLRANASAR